MKLGISESEFKIIIENIGNKYLEMPVSNDIISNNIEMLKSYNGYELQLFINGLMSGKFTAPYTWFVALNFIYSNGYIEFTELNLKTKENDKSLDILIEFSIYFYLFILYMLHTKEWGILKIIAIFTLSPIMLYIIYKKNKLVIKGVVKSKNIVLMFSRSMSVPISLAFLVLCLAELYFIRNEFTLEEIKLIFLYEGNIKSIYILITNILSPSIFIIFILTLYLLSAISLISKKSTGLLIKNWGRSNKLIIFSFTVLLFSVGIHNNFMNYSENISKVKLKIVKSEINKNIVFKRELLVLSFIKVEIENNNLEGQDLVHLFKLVNISKDKALLKRFSKAVVTDLFNSIGNYQERLEGHDDYNELYKNYIKINRNLEQNRNISVDVVTNLLLTVIPDMENKYASEVVESLINYSVKNIDRTIPKSIVSMETAILWYTLNIANINYNNIQKNISNNYISAINKDIFVTKNSISFEKRDVISNGGKASVSKEKETINFQDKKVMRDTVLKYLANSGNDFNISKEEKLRLERILKYLDTADNNTKTFNNPHRANGRR